MQRIRTAASTLALACGTLLSACTTAKPSTAETPPSTSDEAINELPSYGAPKVDRPLDISQFLKAPCDSLARETAEEFLGTAQPVQNSDTGAGPSCNWYTSTSNASMHVTFVQLDNMGLTSLYRNMAGYEFFEEIDSSADYPTVAYGVNDNRDHGECTVRVGTSDQESTDVTVFLSDDRVGRLDPCEAAHEVATAVIGNIKARN
ncbi:DUF3558 domain-containing protein [Saccharomonospora sp. NPDC006951]